MQADRSESKTPGSRPQAGARFWALPVAVAAVLAMGPVQADPVPDGGPLTSGYGYDAEGNLTTVNLPKGNGQPDARQNTHGYDSLGRRTSSKLAAPAAGASAPELGFGYDGLDQLKKVTDPRKLDTTYTTSGLGNTTTQGSPDTGTTQVTYYPDGRVWTVTDSRSKVSTFEYDDLGRLTKISYSAGKASQFEYDGGVQTTNNSTGQLSKLTDESGYTAYTHDGLGRVLTKTQAVGTANQKFTLKQAWGDTGTGASKLQSQNYPSKAQLNYAYDEAGRLKSITLNPVKADGSGTKLTQTIPLLSDITYDALNQVKNWTWGAGVTYTRSFDTQGRLSTYPLGNPFGTGNAAGLIRTMGYDDAGRIVSYTHTNGSGTSKPAFNQTFSYDGLDRLKQQQLQASSFGYDYDLSNNRTSQTLAGSTYANTIATDSNRLMKERNGQGTTTFTYDNAGNLKTDGTNNFTYSARGRLASVAMAADTVSYLYNALDQRVLKTGPTGRVDSGSRYYAYDEQGHLIGDYDADGSPGTYGYEVVYLGDTPVAVINQTRTLVNGALNIVTNVSYVYADHIDTPRVIARSSDHAIQWRWDLSEAFGNAPPNDNPNALGIYTFNLRFPGQTYDKEAGLSYNHHRDYRAQSGRYAESDPIGLDGGINTYAYVGGNPISSIDPSGLDCIAAGNRVTCSVPGWPTVSFPRPDGWPSVINGSSKNHHIYNYPADLTGLDLACVEKFIRDNPTPGRGAATAAGADIDATPDRFPEKFSSNPVKSYRTSYTDANGGSVQVVINVTQPGHGLWPGYVVRTVSGSQLNNFGEGMAWAQNTDHWTNRLTGNSISDRINSVWDEANKKMRSQCSCGAK